MFMTGLYYRIKYASSHLCIYNPVLLFCPKVKVIKSEVCEECIEHAVFVLFGANVTDIF